MFGNNFLKFLNKISPPPAETRDCGELTRRNLYLEQNQPHLDKQIHSSTDIGARMSSIITRGKI